jgi:hypothetical protein
MGEYRAFRRVPAKKLAFVITIFYAVITNLPRSAVPCRDERLARGLRPLETGRRA